MRKIISKKNKTLIIAEAGINHNGDINLAHQLIDAASSSGADAVKFQIFNSEEVVHPNCPRPGHEKANVKEEISHLEMLKKWELSFDDFIELKKHADEKNILFCASTGNAKATNFLVNLDCKLIKIASADMSHFQMLEIAGKSGAVILVSTGMSHWKEIVDSINFMNNFTHKIGVLKCTSNYPASSGSMNLNGLLKLQEEFPNFEIGFSDHSIGNEASVCSVMLGCTILEKHFTIDNGMWGPDHSSSLNPINFKNYVEAIRKIEVLMGKKHWDVQDEEKGQRSTMTKGTYAKKNLVINQKVTLNDVNFLRPCGEISPKEFYLNYNGKKLNKNIDFNNEIKMNDFVK